MTGHLITAPARALDCPRCGQPVITAITGGITVTVTPAPLDPAGEIAARLSGRQTYDVLISGTGRRMYLEWRGAERVRSREHAIVAAHPCRITVPAAAGTEIRIPPPGESFPGKPPF